MNSDTHGTSSLQFLTDNTDFTVVGVIGPPGVGKSTIMNELYGFDGSSPGELSEYVTVFCFPLVKKIEVAWMVQPHIFNEIHLNAIEKLADSYFLLLSMHNKKYRERKESLCCRFIIILHQLETKVPFTVY